MPSYKRRRAINIDAGYINSLKHISKHAIREKHSPTAIASLIFEGRALPLESVERVGKTKGVSMTEAMWLSIRHRADRLDASVSATAQLILSGREGPLSESEISFGARRALERERSRAADAWVGSRGSSAPQAAPEPPPAPAIPTLPPPARLLTVESPPFPALNQPPPAPEAPKVVAVKELREKESKKKRAPNMNLSKGEAVSAKEEDRESQKIVPGKDWYGGFFSI